MLRRSHTCLSHPNTNNVQQKFGIWWRPGRNRMRPLEHFSRKARGISKWQQSPSRRVPVHARFNPEGVINTKGTTGEAMKWWHHHRRMLPNVPPEGWREPQPLGRAAWPKGWTDKHANRVLAIPPAEIGAYVLRSLQRIIHEEVLQDGYDLREIDYEGNPKTELPDLSVIESFVLEEQTLRDRVLRRVLDEDLRIPVTSVQRRDIRSVGTLIRHIEAVLATFREPQNFQVPPAVADFLAEQKVQPRFGFQFALPAPERPTKLEQAWEKLFLHDWQYGRALYEPRSTENTRGNLTWLRLERDWEARAEFEKQVKTHTL